MTLQNISNKKIYLIFFNIINLDNIIKMLIFVVLKKYQYKKAEYLIQIFSFILFHLIINSTSVLFHHQCKL